MSDVQKFYLQEGIDYVKIHGLQRSGTNYLAYLIDANFERVGVLQNEGGWKHGHYCAPWALGREVHVLVATKNPYAWLVSLYGYWRREPLGPDLAGVTFGEFVRGPAVFEEQAGTPFLYRAANPVQHWNAMNYHWLSVRLNDKQCLAVPYEALLLDCEGVIGKVGEALGLRQKTSFTKPLREVVPSGKGFALSPCDWGGRDHYLQETFLTCFDKDLLAFVAGQLDHDLVQTLGYAVVK